MISDFGFRISKFRQFINRAENSIGGPDGDSEFRIPNSELESFPKESTP